MKKTTMLKKFISLLLISAMVLSMASFVFAANTGETLHYVSFGSSVACGYCLKEYMEILYTTGENPIGYRLSSPKIYQYLFGQYLKQNLASISEAAGINYTNVDVDQLSYVGARVQDYRYLIEYGNTDAFPADEITQCNIEGREYSNFTASLQVGAKYGLGLTGLTTEQAVQAFHDDIVASVKEANILTIECGANEFPQFSLCKRQYNIVPDLDAKLKEIGCTFDYYDVYNVVASALKALNIVDLDDYETEVALAEDLTYDYIDFVINYDALIADILEINPDVKIMYMSSNFSGSRTKTFGSITVNIEDVSKILTLLNSLCPLSFSNYKDNVIYVPTDKLVVDTFIEEAFGDVSDYSEDLVYGLNYYLTSQLGLSKSELSNIENGFNSECSIEDVYKRLRCLFDRDAVAATNDVCLSKADCLAYALGQYEGDADYELIRDSLFKFSQYTSFPTYRTHPNAKGHYIKYECLRDAYEANLTAAQVAEQRNEQAMEDVFTAISGSMSNLASEIKNQMTSNFRSIMSGTYISISDMFTSAYNAMISNFEVCFDNILSAIGL